MGGMSETPLSTKPLVVLLAGTSSDDGLLPPDTGGSQC